ncbi:hypothetical protein N864_19685 [Intrasporangium chromatireducens Q5-1]|uniref:Uncharacterized protein n=1 Tax=Intrasporangium chromatireducens Q5-1 TaxID=584657 RepID=W9GP01_9MICO|nr:hypothetical protein N864_19685 [Intrasporangium chromatireducens Q5-1]
MNFAASSYPPLALGFFGLGTGYLIYGPQELFGWPARDERVDRSTGIWGIWLPGFCQFVTGIILFIGLTWFNVFKEAPLYMAALAFTAYGIHWFAIGYNRWQRADPRPNAGMTVAFTVISVTGLLVFFIAGDWPVGLLFCGLALIYISDFFASIGVGLGERSLGFWHLLTGAWLMYLTFATAMNFAVHWHLPL